jgi:small subunit ribosomal protein S20
MPQHKSAAKRVVTNEKRRVRNASVKANVKTLVKKVRSGTKKEDLVASLREAFAALDKAAKKRIYHPRTAARRKSRLAKHVNRVAAAAPQL